MSGGYGPGGYPGQGYDAPDYDDGRPRPRPRGDQRQGYGNAPGYGPGYGGQQGYDDPRDSGYDQRSYPPRGSGAGGYRQQGTGPQQYGTGGMPQYDPRGRGNRGQDQGDSSFLPGFGAQQRGGRYDDGRYGYDDPRVRPDRRGPGYRGQDPRGGDYGPGGRDYWDDRDRRPRKRATRWIPRILVLTIVGALLVGGLVGGLYIYHKYEARYHPADYAGAGTGEVTVQVKTGDTAFSLAPRLVQLGVVASARAFTNAAEATTSTTAVSSTGLQAGFYQLHEHMQASLAYAALINPKNRVQTTVTIPEGKRAVDVIAIIARKSKIPLKDFQQVLAHPSQLGLPSYANGKVEGYLFPATYAFVPHETALQILQAMVQRFSVEAQGHNLVSAARSVGLTPTQLIIEASLAQAEGGSVSDYPKIAEVIHNRLAQGMHLQFDSTVLYGLGKYAVSATFAQIHTPGPYNTYLNAGLPVGPISNPGDAAIQGVLHPAQGNYLYFLTKPGGKSEFSPTPLQGQ